MTIKISLELARHVSPERIAHLYSIRDSRAALLAEAKTAASDEHLSAWRDEANALVSALTHSFIADEARIAAFEALVPELEKRLRELLVAVAVRDNALRAHSLGSPDKASALRLRDDHDSAESARGFAFRAFHEAKAEALAALPSSGSLEAPPGADVVEALGSYVINKKFSPEYAVIAAEAKKRWMEAPDSETMYWPLHSHRLVNAAPREWEDAHRVSVSLPRKYFFEEFAALKLSRVAHRLAKVRQAQTIVDNARAALEGVAT